MAETSFRRRIARWRRLQRFKPLQVTPDWRVISRSPYIERWRLPVDAANIELSCELLSASHGSSRDVIAAVRFLDRSGLSLSAPGKALRISKSGEAYVHPFDSRIEDAFRLVMRPPDGTEVVEVEFRSVTATDNASHAVRDVMMRPLGGEERLGADLSSWAESRRLMAAVLRFGRAVEKRGGPLHLEQDMFGEAVLEHFVLTNQDRRLATALAEGRLRAGRDREALVLAGLADTPGVKQAQSRRDLLEWASKALLHYATADRASGVVFHVAQNVDAQGRECLFSRLTSGDSGSEIFMALVPAPGTDASNLRVVEPFDPVDSACVVRLAEQLVRHARGRNVACLRGYSLTDALAAAVAARRLGVRSEFEAGDLVELRSVLMSPDIASSDAADRERALYDLAFKAVDQVDMDDDSRTWLSHRGFTL